MVAGLWRRLHAGRVGRDGERLAERVARRALARSVCEFSRRTRAAADDKLSFTAALVRAGELDEAARVLSEFEADVRAGEALLDRNVRAFRPRPRRPRAVALAAAGLVPVCALALSAAGYATVGLIGDLGREGRDQGRATSPGSRAAVRAVALPGGGKLELPRAVLRRHPEALVRIRKELRTGGRADPERLVRLLVPLVGPERAAALASTLAAGVVGDLTGLGLGVVAGIPEAEPAREAGARPARRRAQAQAEDAERRETPPPETDEEASETGRTPSGQPADGRDAPDGNVSGEGGGPESMLPLGG